MNIVHLSAVWVDKHGTFLGIITPRGHLMLEHDTFDGAEHTRSVPLSTVLPKFLIHDLEKCLVIYQARGGSELRREPFTSWLKRNMGFGDHVECAVTLGKSAEGVGNITLNPVVMGHSVPMETQQIIIRYEGRDIDGKPYQKVLACIPIKRDMRIAVPEVRRPAPTLKGGGH